MHDKDRAMFATFARRVAYLLALGVGWLSEARAPGVESPDARHTPSPDA